jgi:dolichol kinase
MVRTRTIQKAALGVETVRKSIHLLVALVPAIAALDVSLAMALVGAGTIFYVAAESARRSGLSILLVTDLTMIASRDRETDRFVLGPVTLGLGAMLALTLYPLPASTIAIFALAFGDTAASLVGKAVGGLSIPFAPKKTLAGSVACLLAVALISSEAGLTPSVAIVVATVATILEAYAPDDMDNILIPVGTGLAATLLT